MLLINNQSKVVKIMANAKELKEKYSILPPFNKKLARQIVIVHQFDIVPNIDSEKNASKIYLEDEEVKRRDGSKHNIWTLPNNILKHII